MAQTLRVVFALLALVVLLFALRPLVPVRQKPVPTPPTAMATAGTLVIDLVDRDDEAARDAVSRRLGVPVTWREASARDDIALAQVPDMAAAIQTLESEASWIEAVEPEQILTAYAWPNDPMYEQQWNLRAMGAPAGWSSTPRGAGVVVAVIDTGVTRVEDLQQTSMLEGKSFVPGAASAADDNGHGTHVAGTVAQATHNGVGVAGVAPAATILPVKVLSNAGFGSSAWIASGIHWAVEQGADVINLSLGGGYSPVIHEAVKDAVAHGVIVVAAAGNSGREGVGYPGALSETIGVSAVGPSGELAPYSSWGKGVDIAAPGGDKQKLGGGILQDTVDGRGGHAYLEFQGTSMATPHVAGAAAALLSAGLEPDAVTRTLLDAASPAASGWRPRLSGTALTGPRADWDPKIGYGRLDLNAAVASIADRWGGVRFALGAAIALICTHVGLSGRFRLIAAATAAVVAGGLVVLTWLPLPSNLAITLVSAPFLHWPGVIAGDTWWSGCPLWLSAALPVAVAFVPGAFRGARALSLGFVSGIAAHLLFGAIAGTLNPWWMGSGVDAVWLAANAAACVVLALALAGTEKLEARESP